MTDLTQKRLDELAVFAGGTQFMSYGPANKTMGLSWSFNGQVIPSRDWHPDRDPAQADLVLRALVKKRTVYLCLYAGHGEHGADLDWTPTKLADDPEVEGASWWLEAVCAAASEVIAKGSTNDHSTE